MGSDIPDGMRLVTFVMSEALYEKFKASVPNRKVSYTIVKLISDHLNRVDCVNEFGETLLGPRGGKRGSEYLPLEGEPAARARGVPESFPENIAEEEPN